MCRSIRPLHNFQPPATNEEIHDAALQFVRKVSGMTAPSNANREPFELAVRQVAEATRGLLEALVTTSAPHDRDVERARARARFEARQQRIVRQAAEATPR